MGERTESQYVKLTKDQVPLEDITPGELNQPIEVPQVWIHTALSFVFCFFLEFIEEIFCFSFVLDSGLLSDCRIGNDMVLNCSGCLDFDMILNISGNCEQCGLILSQLWLWTL